MSVNDRAVSNFVLRVSRLFLLFLLFLLSFLLLLVLLLLLMSVLALPPDIFSPGNDLSPQDGRKDSREEYSRAQHNKEQCEENRDVVQCDIQRTVFGVVGGHEPSVAQ